MATREQRIPERRWWKRWEDSYRNAGGFAGGHTLIIQRDHALRYFRAGATAKAAGVFCAEQYQLFSAGETTEEWANGMREDIREALDAKSLEPLDVYRAAQ